MKNLLSVILITAFLGTTALQLSRTSEQDSRQQIQNRFIGAWRLVWLEEPDGARSVHKADCTGLLVYTRDGHMSVRFSMRKVATKLRLVPIKSTRTYTLSFFMSKAPWCAVSSAKIFHVLTNSLETNCS